MGESGGFFEAIKTIVNLFVASLSVRAYKAEVLNSLSKRKRSIKQREDIISTRDIVNMTYYFKCCLRSKRYKKIEKKMDNLDNSLEFESIVETI